jgi:hypothetical protein
VAASGELSQSKSVLLKRMSGLPACFSPWQLEADDIAIAVGLDGQEMRLGSGGYGQVGLPGRAAASLKRGPSFSQLPSTDAGVSFCMPSLGQAHPCAAQVFLATLKGAIPVAVKKLHASSSDPVQREEFVREVAMLKELNNSNIVQFQVRRLAAYLSTVLPRRCPYHRTSQCNARPRRMRRAAPARVRPRLLPSLPFDSQQHAGCKAGSGLMLMRLVAAA